MISLKNDTAINSTFYCQFLRQNSPHLLKDPHTPPFAIGAEWLPKSTTLPAKLRKALVLQGFKMEFIHAFYCQLLRQNSPHLLKDPHTSPFAIGAEWLPKSTTLPAKLRKALVLQRFKMEFIHAFYCQLLRQNSPHLLKDPHTPPFAIGAEWLPKSTTLPAKLRKALVLQGFKMEFIHAFYCQLLRQNSPHLLKDPHTSPFAIGAEWLPKSTTLPAKLRKALVLQGFKMEFIHANYKVLS